MPLVLYRPMTSGIRHASVIRDGVKKQKRIKSLTSIRRKTGGRNAQGKITVRHQGGGAKQFVRHIDTNREKFDIPARVIAIQYDPIRSARIALVTYRDGEKRYILAPQGLEVGATVMSSQKQIEVNVGNQLKLKFIPTGMQVFAIELRPGGGSKLCRSAGNYAVLNTIDSGNALLKLPSGEVRMVSEECMATIGMASNAEWRNIRWGKAGRMRHRGIRPSVRGKAMNPVDHPHGGGEGKHPIGMKHPKTYTGKIAMGVKTRKVKKYSDHRIIHRRKGNKL